MNVLIACEESQAVCIEARRLGHNAFSCDIQECSGGHPEWHIMGDVLPLLNGRCSFETMDGARHEIEGRWDAIIAHPPCTYLTNAGNAWRNRPGRKEETEKAAEFFLKIANADCEQIAIENPPGWMNSHWRRADQTIHPWYFSERNGDENHQMKRTCIWLKGFRPLAYNIRVTKPEPKFVKKRSDGTIKNRYFVDAMSPNKDRAKNRSKTFPGIARAMAEQWLGDVAKGENV